MVTFFKACLETSREPPIHGLSFCYTASGASVAAEPRRVTRSGLVPATVLCCGRQVSLTANSDRRGDGASMTTAACTNSTDSRTEQNVVSVQVLESGRRELQHVAAHSLQTKTAFILYLPVTCVLQTAGRTNASIHKFAKSFNGVFTETADFQPIFSPNI